MLTIIAFDDDATAAGTKFCFSRFAGCIVAVAELEDAPLVFNDGDPESGAAYPVGSEEDKFIM